MPSPSPNGLAEETQSNGVTGQNFAVFAGTGQTATSYTFSGGSGHWSVTGIEISGETSIDTQALDVQTSPTANPNAATITTTQPNDLVLAVLVGGGGTNTVMTTGSGYSNEVNLNSQGINRIDMATVASPGSTHDSWITSLSEGYYGYSVAISGSSLYSLDNCLVFDGDTTYLNNNLVSPNPAPTDSNSGTIISNISSIDTSNLSADTTPTDQKINTPAPSTTPVPVSNVLNATSEDWIGCTTGCDSNTGSGPIAGGSFYIEPPGDSHAYVIDGPSCTWWETYQTHWTPMSGPLTVTAGPPKGGISYPDIRTTAYAPTPTNPSYATQVSHIPLLGSSAFGDDEEAYASVGVIPHPIGLLVSPKVTFDGHYVFPAGATASGSCTPYTSCLLAGDILRYTGSCSSYVGANLVMCNTLKTYGAVVTDTTGTAGMCATKPCNGLRLGYASDGTNPWTDIDTLTNNLHLSDFEVIKRGTIKN